MENNAVFQSIDEILSKVNLNDVTSESNGRENIPDGYYMCEVEKAEITVSKSSGTPQVAFRFTILEDGTDVVVEADGSIAKNSIARTKNRKIFMYYPLKDERSVKRFVSDMLKFEGDTAGEPLLSKEYFTTSEVLEDALDILCGMRIYVQVSTSTNKEGQEMSWQNLVSWKRVDQLELN